MSTTDQGRQAESAVAKHLEVQGFRTVAANWRTRRCEIDLVALKDGVIYCIEVNYRYQSAQGDGFDHITEAKRRQMELAAHIWALENNWPGDYRLMAAAVTGDGCEIIEVLEL